MVEYAKENNISILKMSSPVTDGVSINGVSPQNFGSYSDSKLEISTGIFKQSGLWK